MTKKNASIFLMIIFFTLTIMNVCFANERKGSMGKAEGFVKVKMYSDAINELRKVIDDDPTNARAHLMLGDCYLATNSPSSALESYERYSILKPGSSEMAKKFFQLGNGFLAKGQHDDAKRSYDKAASSNKSYRQMAANSFFSKGRALLFNGDTNTAERLFAYACSLDGSYASQVDQAKADYGTALLARAKGSRGEERKKLKEQAVRYVSREIADKAVPPPVLTAVHSGTFTGIGFKGGDGNDGGVLTFEYGSEIKLKDVVLVEGNTAEVWDSGKWQKAGVPTTNNTGTSKRLTVRAERGEKINVTIKRMID